MTATGTPPAGTLGAGWRQLRAAPDRVLVPTLVLSTGGVAAHVLLQFLLGELVAGSTRCPRPYLGEVLAARCGPSDGRALLTLVLGLGLLYLVGQLVVLGLYRTALDLTDGLDIRSPLRGWFGTRSLLLAAAAAVLLTLNTFFLLLPAVLLGFLVRYAPLFVLDRGLGPVAALVASTRLVVGDLAGEAWFVLRAVALLLAGLLLLGVGLYLAVPVVLLAQTQRYRTRNPV